MTTTTTWSSRGTAPRDGAVDGVAEAVDVPAAVEGLGEGKDAREEPGAVLVAAPLHPASTTVPSASPTTRPTRIQAL
ncbi:hypothetical protein [Oryzihumus sp.]|uniref:hypothetical protein n=1 Tax=Oryzihumus sp. TaxID=1968903 RepID=UPI002ED93D07